MARYVVWLDNCGGNHSINRFRYTDLRLFDDSSGAIWITDLRIVGGMVGVGQGLCVCL